MLHGIKERNKNELTTLDTFEHLAKLQKATSSRTEHTTLPKMAKTTADLVS